MQNLPVNHRTLEGQVTEVAFDPTKAQNHDFVTFRVKFDVSKPLGRSKLTGEVITILYDYERLQKRYICCQRLTHARDSCPVFLRQKQPADSKSGWLNQKKKGHEFVLKASDPLFGLLTEDHVGLNPLTGRPKIAESVLEEMRQYLSVDNGEPRIVKQARVKSYVACLEKDPLKEKDEKELHNQEAETCKSPHPNRIRDIKLVKTPIQLRNYA